MPAANIGGTAAIQAEEATVPTKKCNIPEFMRVFSYPQSGKSIQASVQKFGVIQPLVVKADSEGAYAIICGAKRLLAACELGIDAVPARIFPALSFSERECFDLAFADNSSAREFNVVEIAGIVSVLSGTFGEPEKNISSNYLSVIGRRGGRNNFDNYRVINFFDDDIKGFLVQWNIPHSIAAILYKFKEIDRNRVFEIMKTLQLHGGKLKQFLTLCYEITRMRKIPTGKLLDRQDLVRIINDSKTTLSQKQHKLLDLLHNERYPNHTELQRKYSKIANSLADIEKGAITPPPQFEGNKLKAQLFFKSLKDLDNFCSALQDESNREKIQKLLKLI